MNGGTNRRNNDSQEIRGNLTGQKYNKPLTIFNVSGFLFVTKTSCAISEVLIMVFDLRIVIN
jgi:hypothetical protein